MSAPPLELEYVEEGGPGIPELPKGATAPPREAPAQQQELPGWDPEAIREFLKGTGAGIHMWAGKGENDWRFIEEDLDRLVGPLTRISNRWEPALKLSPLADPLLVAHGLWLWAWRSALERQRALMDAEEQERASASPRPRYEQTDATPSSNGAAAEITEEELEYRPMFPQSPMAQGGDEDE